jgi:hypothetical protein
MSTTEANYYQDNLNKLGKVNKQDSIKILCNGKATNYFAVNNESIKALKEWINNL